LDGPHPIAKDNHREDASRTQYHRFSRTVTSRWLCDANNQALRLGGTVLLYMIIEHFKNRDPVPVYRRFRDRGRLAPESLQYVSSWVDEKLERCFQLMETENPTSLEEWLANWNDLVEFEVYPVITSAEAVEKVSSRL